MFCPDETNSNRLNAVFDATNRCTMEPTVSIDDHLGSRRPRDGSAQRALLRRLARGLSAHRPPRHVVLVRGLRAGSRFDGHAARQMDGAMHRISVAPAHRLAERVAHQPRLAQRSQRLQPSGAGLRRQRAAAPQRSGPRLLPAGFQLPAECFRSLPAQPQLRQRGHLRQAAGAAMA